jgi:hypothetical protein
MVVTDFYNLSVSMFIAGTHFFSRPDTDTEFKRTGAGQRETNTKPSNIALIFRWTEGPK